MPTSNIYIYIYIYIIIVALRICPLKFMHLKFEYTWYIFNFRFVKAAEMFQETHVQQNTERWDSNTNISELSNIIRIYSKAAKRINRHKSATMA